MNEIDEAAFDDLWGSSLSDVHFDPVKHELRLSLEAVDEGRKSVYELRLLGVRAMRFCNSIPEPWSYAEVTEFKMQPIANGLRRLEMVLWSEDAQLTVDCACVRRSYVDDR